MRLMTVIGVFLAIALGGCIRTGCDNTTCLNEGVCVQGNCACLAGYEGDHCEDLWADKYSNVWQATDNYPKDVNKHNYTVSVTMISKDTFLLNDLMDSLGAIYCYRAGVRTFNMLGVANSDSSIVVKNGTGDINDAKNSVTGSYSFTLNDSSITTYFTWQR